VVFAPNDSRIAVQMKNQRLYMLPFSDTALGNTVSVMPMFLFQSEKTLISDEERKQQNMF